MGKFLVYCPKCWHQKLSTECYSKWLTAVSVQCPGSSGQRVFMAWGTSRGQTSLWRRTITKVMVGLQFQQANSVLVTEISSGPLSFTSCPPHYSPATLSLDSSPSVLLTTPKQIHYRTLGTKLLSARISYHIFSFWHQHQHGKMWKSLVHCPFEPYADRSAWIWVLGEPQALCHTWKPTFGYLINIFSKKKTFNCQILMYPSWKKTDVANSNICQKQTAGAGIQTNV